MHSFHSNETWIFYYLVKESSELILPLGFIKIGGAHPHLHIFFILASYSSQELFRKYSNSSRISTANSIYILLHSLLFFQNFVELREFAVAGTHVAPKKVKAELQLMDDVHDFMVKRFGTQV